VEADDFDGYGGMWDRFLADPGGQTFMATLNTSSRPAAAYQTTVWMDVPI
jgi:hypothetical protein